LVSALEEAKKEINGGMETRQEKRRMAREGNSSITSNCYKAASESLLSHMHSSSRPG